MRAARLNWAHHRPPKQRMRPVGMRGSLRPVSHLSPAFVEWMMGLPAGHLCDVPGITRNQALKAAGNGVVPQQAYAALSLILGAGEAAA